MNAETIRRNTLLNQAWLERAVLVLDARQAWDEEDVKKGTGAYIAQWIRRQRQNKVDLGKCLTSDIWVGRARFIVQKYTTVLMQYALEKAERDFDWHAEQAKRCYERVESLRRDLGLPVVVEEPTAPVAVESTKKPKKKSRRKQSAGK